jgi:hypothetical protein
MSENHGSVLRNVKKSQRAEVNKNQPQQLTAQDQKEDRFDETVERLAR